MDHHDNGMHAFTCHRHAGYDNAVKGVITDFKKHCRKMVEGSMIKPEDAGRFYLKKTFEATSDAFASFTRPHAKTGARVEFEPYQVEYIPFTSNTIVKFRQKVNNISVYGSNVNVELDKKRNLISINSNIAPLTEVDTVAKTSAADAIKTAADYLDKKIPDSVLPLLYIYYVDQKWKLVYIIKSVFRKPNTGGQVESEDADLCEALNCVNIIVDAETGKLIKATPRTTELTAQAAGDDEIQYDISVRENGEVIEMVDDDLNVITYDLDSKSYAMEGALPGLLISLNDERWLPAGVNAHFNACKVAVFLKNVLKRNGIDNQGMNLVSTVRCVQGFGMLTWDNAVWYSSKKQMVYGQVDVDGVRRTLARSLSIVAHEVMHGVTEATSNLEFVNQTGALNESYSDIFGIIIANFENPDIATWDWELGGGPGVTAIRDLSNPGKHGQPSHMDNYQLLPEEGIDKGGVHTNSGIHNKAAFNLISTKDASGKFLFPINEPPVLFYMTLIQLSQTAGFRDSLRSMLNAANSLFQRDPKKDEKINAITKAFNDVGIKDE